MDSATEEGFFRAARAWARYHAHRAGLSRDCADECAQAFVVRLLFVRMNPPLWARPPGQIHALLRTSARNHVITALHRMQSETDGLERLVSERISDSFAVASDISNHVETALMRERFWEKVHSGMRGLTPDQRDLFERFYVEETVTTAVVTAYGCSADSIRHRLARLCRRLESALAEQGDTEAELRSCLPSAAVCYCRARGREEDSEGW